MTRSRASRTARRPQPCRLTISLIQLGATGSPFPPVDRGHGPMPVAQCNNCYVFPGVGLGVISVGARRVTEEMFMAAAHALRDASPALPDPEAPLLPLLTDIRVS